LEYIGDRHLFHERRLADNLSGNKVGPIAPYFAG
jgi:hypothetical protein